MADFEWDANKRLANIRKHGIDFATATRIFDDAKAYTYISTPQGDEARFVTVGRVEGVMMAVVYTMRDETVRIISVRTARRQERARYG
jgi:uncharacterized protein